MLANTNALLLVAFLIAHIADEIPNISTNAREAVPSARDYCCPLTARDAETSKAKYQTAYFLNDQIHIAEKTKSSV